MSTKMWSATYHRAGWQICQPRRAQRQITEKDSEFVDRDSVVDKSQCRKVNLSTETQSVTNCREGWQICQTRRDRRQIVEQDSEFVNRDVVIDKS